jgi:hypothetical protein
MFGCFQKLFGGDDVEGWCFMLRSGVPLSSCSSMDASKKIWLKNRIPLLTLAMQRGLELVPEDFEDGAVSDDSFLAVADRR